MKKKEKREEEKNHGYLQQRCDADSSFDKSFCHIDDDSDKSEQKRRELGCERHKKRPLTDRPHVSLTTRVKPEAKQPLIFVI